MNLKSELKKLDQYILTNEEGFKKHYLWLKENAANEQDAKEIDDYAERCLLQSIDDTGRAIEELTVKVQ